MRKANESFLRFLITLVFLPAASHVAAQNSAPTPQASPSHTIQSPSASANLDTPPAASSDNAGEAQTTSESESKAPSPASGTLEVEIGYSYEHLTNGFAPWQSAHLFVGKRFASRQSLYGIYRETSRIGQRDREGMVNFYQPFGRRWAALLEAQASPTHRVLPKWSAFAQVERNFGRGWVGSAGYRRTVFNTAQVNTGVLNVERYFSRYRAAYTLYVSGLEGAGTSTSHRGQFNFYYGEESSTLGVSFAAGREIENLGTRILRSPVQSFAVQGRHWLHPRWSVNYDFTFHRQADIYTRRGFGVGLRYRF